VRFLAALIADCSAGARPPKPRQNLSAGGLLGGGAAPGRGLAGDDQTRSPERGQRNPRRPRYKSSAMLGGDLPAVAVTIWRRAGRRAGRRHWNHSPPCGGPTGGPDAGPAQRPVVADAPLTSQRHNKFSSDAIWRAIAIHPRAGDQSRSTNPRASTTCPTRLTEVVAATLALPVAPTSSPTALRSRCHAPDHGRTVFQGHPRRRFGAERSM